MENRRRDPTVVCGFRTYTGAEGKPVAQRSAKAGTAGSVLSWLFTTLDGTVDAQTNAATGATVHAYRDPYGTPIAGTSQGWADSTGYLNKQVAEGTGLTNVGARTYDAVLGKFLSVDPVIDTNLPQQNTGYTYAGNNPTTYTDPTGLRLDEGCGWATTCKAAIAKGATGTPKPKGCGAGNWKCQIKKESASCARRTAPRLCDRASFGPFTYDYTFRFPITSKKSPVEVMNVFKSNPSEIFPFVVSRCPTLSQDKICVLHTDHASGTTTVPTDVAFDRNGYLVWGKQQIGYIPNPQSPRGVVGVDVTATSVRFTVLNPDYFDSPGSVISFSTYQDKNGMTWLRQDGHANGTGLISSAGFQIFGKHTWAIQAENLREQLGG